MAYPEVMRLIRQACDRFTDRANFLAASTLLVIAALVLLSALVAGLYFHLESDSIYTRWGLSHHFAHQDLLGVPVVLGALGALLASRSDVLPRPMPDPRSWIVPLAAAVLVLCYAGTFVVFHNYGLSLDEFMAGFDARIFGEGTLFARLPAEWRTHSDALQPLFVLKVPGDVAWSSSYLPGNAAIRALFEAIGDGALASPALAGVAVVLVYLVARKLAPKDGEFACVAVLLFATSSQFLITAMTPYSMTAHLAFNLAWLWLMLHDRPWSRAAALAVSFVACGLHQMVFHPLFVAPFLIWMWATGQRRLALFYSAAIAAFALFWIVYWQLAIAWALPDAPDAAHLGGTFLAERAVTMVYEAMQIGTLILIVENLLRFMTWQNPLALVLVAAAFLTIRRQPTIAQALLGGIVLMFAAIFVLMPYQGHGWGYRYLHGLLGSFALAAAFGWRTIVNEAPELRRRLQVGLGIAILASMAVLLPLRAYQAHHFATPYATASANIAHIDADVVILDSGDRWYGGDLVRNDPFLRRRPIILLDQTLKPGAAQSLCRRYRVKVISDSSPEFGQIRRMTMTDAALVKKAQRLQRLRIAGCGDSSVQDLRTPPLKPTDGSD
ncbi:MAG: hypothetical protein JWN69_1097 [Alphaproteobacteria bacterium]|nr:hypothetical protein [Alphaproteobacteria bacterium]